MFRILLVFIAFLLTISLFTGCTKRKVQPQRHYVQHNTWANESTTDDVDLSDLDQTLTESETFVIEGNEERKIKRIRFSMSEYYRLERTGKGTVEGRIFIKDAYGRPVFGKNTRLYLNPVTSYSEQWYEESYLDGHKMEKADSRLFNYLRFITSNANGEFAFYGVPSGDYYLIGTVKCGEECGYDTMKNIRIAKKLTIRGNQVLVKNLIRRLK